MGMGFAPTWLRQVSPPASQNHFNHWIQRWNAMETPRMTATCWTLHRWILHEQIHVVLQKVSWK